jgi:hypothetical protein
MNVTQEQTATFLHTLCNWIIAQPRKCLLDSYSNIYRYVSCCHATGKMSVSIKDGIPQAVVFHWPDFYEKIEAKAEYGHQQFEFAKTHPGDSLFIGEVIGSREALAGIFKAQIQQTPLLAAVPKYTYRHGKLVKLRASAIERFLK